MAIKLLIVDDEEYIRLPIKDYFEDCGWIVDTFDSGEEALRHLLNNEVDCVIADVRLPGMTGVEFMTEANRLRPGIRFVIYTGAAGYTIKEELDTAGIDNYSVVSKPAFDLEQLRRALEMKSAGE